MWDAISGNDALVVVTDHDEFKKADLSKIKENLRLPIIVDTRRIFDNKFVESLGISYLAIGYPSKTK